MKLFLIFKSPHKIIISQFFPFVNKDLYNIVKFYFLYKKILDNSNNLPIEKVKKVCYNKGAKGQGGTVQ